MSQRHSSMVDLTSTQLSAILRRAGKRIADYSERLTVSNMLQISHEIEPGIVGECHFDALLSSPCVITVNSGGRLLEHFLTVHSSYSIRRSWRSLLKSWARYEQIAPALADMILSVQAKFYFFVLRSLSGRGRQCTMQLFYITLLLSHKGLSRTGINATSQMSLTLPPRTYDDELQRHLMRQDHKIR